MGGVCSIIRTSVLVSESIIHEKNKKSRGFVKKIEHLFTFFEPIEYDSKKRGEDISTEMAKAMAEVMGKLFCGNMAVVVKKTSDNFYKVHRILAPNYRKLDIQNIKIQSLR